MVYECQECGKEFEYEKEIIKPLLEFCNSETPNCPYCGSGDVIEYEEEEE